MKRHQIAGALSGALAVLFLLPPLSGCGPKSGTPASAQDTTGETAPTAVAATPAVSETETLSGSSTPSFRRDLQMALGNPDGAVESTSSPDHYLLPREQYALSYNNRLRFPNWVAWHLAKSDIGSQERGQFRPDPKLLEMSQTFTKVTPASYTGSGYDRGHNCPSKDRSVNRDENDPVFYMSNMTPQWHGLNGGPWAGLENYCRDLASQNNELFIYCGHGFDDKRKEANPDRLKKDGVAIPEFGWKIIVIVPSGTGNSISRITPIARVIAVKMPNRDEIIKDDWRKYQTSVGVIEAKTSLKFFDKLPENVASALKSQEGAGQPMPVETRPTKVPPGPKSGGDSQTVAPPTNATGQVWVNTKSKAYWRPGTEYYGKTKQGKYMTEADAIKAGYHAAGGQ